MSTKGLYTDGSESYSAKVNSIPLRDVDTTYPSENSIGDLVSNATEQMSTLVRSEIELAKTEIIGEVKKGLMGGGFFGAAGVIAAYSSFFFFFFLAELLAVWLDRWAAFLIVFLIMIVIAGILGFMGYQKVKKIRKPEKTIDSVSNLKSLVPGQAKHNLEKKESHLYT